MVELGQAMVGLSGLISAKVGAGGGSLTVRTNVASLQ